MSLLPRASVKLPGVGKRKAILPGLLECILKAILDLFQANTCQHVLAYRISRQDLHVGSMQVGGSTALGSVPRPLLAG